jgi:hypothetical protein
VANYLDFDLLNFDKHGFDAKKSAANEFLEIKQCSLTSGRLGGTWNDTSEDKARAFSDPRLFTVIAVWKGASDLQFMVYGQCKGLGQYLYERVTERKAGTRSTQTIGIEKLIREFGFTVICPPDKKPGEILTLIVTYHRDLAKYVTTKNIHLIQDL